MQSEGRIERLVEFLQDEVGAGLRAVVQYSPEAAGFAHLREDLQGRVNIEDFEPTIDQARKLHEQLETVGQLQGRTLGTPVGNVTVYEHALVLVQRYNEDEGVIATLDRDVGPNLAAFVEHCANVLTGTADPAPSSGRPDSP